MQMAVCGRKATFFFFFFEENGPNLLYKLQDVTLHITRDANIVNKRQVDLGHSS